MQTARMLQAAGLMLIVALAAGCTTSKQYTSKLYGPRTEKAKDPAEYAIKFLELESLNRQEEGWVTTDILSKDSSAVANSIEVIADAGKLPAKEPVVAETKNKSVSVPDIPDIKKVADTQEPVARTSTQNGTRNKTTREK